MATITGDIIELGTTEAWRRPVGGDVVALQDGSAIAHGPIDRVGHFAVELPPGTLGQIELRATILGAAPLIVDLDGAEEISVQILVNLAHRHGY